MIDVEFANRWLVLGINEKEKAMRVFLAHEADTESIAENVLSMRQVFRHDHNFPPSEAITGRGEGNLVSRMIAYYDELCYCIFEIHEASGTRASKMNRCAPAMVVLDTRSGRLVKDL